MTKKVYVISKYRGNTEENIRVARYAGDIIIACDNIPVIPHLYFPQFLNDDVPEERVKAINLGVELMKGCDQIWIVGTEISNGMEFEIEAAKKLRIPTRLYDLKLGQIYYRNLLIDDRVDDRYRRIVRGLKCEEEEKP